MKTSEKISELKIANEILLKAIVKLCGTYGNTVRVADGIQTEEEVLKMIENDTRIAVHKYFFDDSWSSLFINFYRGKTQDDEKYLNDILKELKAVGKYVEQLVVAKTDNRLLKKISKRGEIVSEDEYRFIEQLVSEFSQELKPNEIEIVKLNSLLVEYYKIK